MTSVWDFFKDLFKQADESSASNPLIHEAIERSGEEMEVYQNWKESLECRRFVDWLNDQYAIWEALPHDIDAAIDFLNTPSSKGFAVHFHKTERPYSEVDHLFDFLKEKVLNLNYKAQMSDTRTWSDKKAVVRVDRHYLKPRTFITSNSKIDQQFGNIMIELQFRDNQPYDLKFRATNYHDRLYEKANDFKDLMLLVLQ